jgi:exosortase/archaeosortase family protein
MATNAKNRFIRQVGSFLLIFLSLYGGMQVWIGLTVPGGRFDLPWLEQYANFPALFRYSLLRSGGLLLDIVNVDTYILESYHLRMVNGRGIRMVYSCMGIGIIAFWVAFAVAFAVSKKHALIWTLAGVLFIWWINVVRVALLVLATNRDWPMPLNLDHHTWFNLAVYAGIGVMMYYYDKHARRLSEPTLSS